MAKIQPNVKGVAVMGNFDGDDYIVQVVIKRLPRKLKKALRTGCNRGKWYDRKEAYAERNERLLMQWRKEYDRLNP